MVKVRLRLFFYSLGCEGNAEERRMRKRTQFFRVDSRTENILFTCVTDKFRIATILSTKSSLYTDVVLFSFSFFSKLSASV